MNKKELTAELEKIGMRPGRGLGQNFLLDGNLLDWIVRHSKVQSGDAVLEVGPGFGALTERLLAAGAQVTAVEFDHRLADYLRKKFSGNPSLRLIEADACRTDFAALFPAGQTFKAIANLPYAISSVFIAKMLELENPPATMFFMLQKEMAERLAAEPGTKAYGALTVRTQLCYDVRIEKIVPPDVFCPPPEVESALAGFQLKAARPVRTTEKVVSQIVRTVFNQRRKQMGKVLGTLWNREIAAAVLEKCGFSVEVRPDKLSVENFIALAEALPGELEKEEKKMQENNKGLIAEIQKLKKERQALILAHNYVAGEVQDIADFCGDSLELSIKASQSDAPVLVMCGVRFMGETAKLLSPKATVLLARPDAGCPMADMVDAAKLRSYRAHHPDALAIAYVNTTAEVKALVDLCCTSGNAEKIVSHFPQEQEIIFLPDRNLGGNLNNSLKRKMDLWEGCCPIHDKVTPKMIEAAKAEHPGAPVLLHPECRPEAIAAADVALSTGGMLKYIQESKGKEFIIGTESGIIHRLRRENPDKIFYPLLPELICTDMKKITLQDVADVLREMKNEVVLDPALAEKAAAAIKKMLEIK